MREKLNKLIIVYEKNIKFLIIGFIFFSFFLILIINPQTYITTDYKIKDLKGIALNDGVEIVQKFETDNNYTSIGFLASNELLYNDKGYVYVSLLNNKHKLLKKYKLSASEICNDNYYYKYYYFKYKFKKNKTYYLIISSSKLSNDIYIGGVKNNNKGLYINNERNDSTVALSFMYKKGYIYLYWYLLLFTSLVVLIISGKENKK